MEAGLNLKEERKNLEEWEKRMAREAEIVAMFVGIRWKWGWLYAFGVDYLSAGPCLCFFGYRWIDLNSLVTER